QLLLLLGTLQTRWLEYRQVAGQGQCLHGAGLQLLAPPRSAIRLGVHGYYTVPGFQQTGEVPCGKRGCSGKDDVQGWHGGSAIELEERRLSALQSGHLLVGFLEFGADSLALELAQIIHEQPAVEVVDLVLDTGGEQTIRFQFEALAIAVQRCHPYRAGARYRLIEAGYGKTALVILAEGVVYNLNLGVDEHQWGVLLLRNIDNNQLFVNIHLGGGKPDARCGIHGFEHVVDGLPQRVIDLRDRRRLASQSQIGKFEYV